jgi:tetratricopeptide (TPR) repeat protein
MARNQKQLKWKNIASSYISVCDLQAESLLQQIVMKALYLLFSLFLFASCSSTLVFEVDNYNPPEESEIPLRGNIIIVNTIPQDSGISYHNPKSSTWLFHQQIYGQQPFPKEQFLVQTEYSDTYQQSIILTNNLIQSIGNNSTYDSIMYLHMPSTITEHMADSIAETYRCSTIIILDELESRNSYKFDQRYTYTHYQSHLVQIKFNIPYSSHKYYYSHESRLLHGGRPYFHDNEHEYISTIIFTSHKINLSQTKINNHLHYSWNIYSAEQKQFLDPIQGTEKIESVYLHPYANHYSLVPNFVTDSTKLIELIDSSASKAAPIMNESISKQLNYTWEKNVREIYIKGHGDFELAELYFLYNNWDAMAKIWETHLNSDNKTLASRAYFNMAVYHEINGNLDLAITCIEKSIELSPTIKAENYLKQLTERNRK